MCHNSKNLPFKKELVELLRMDAYFFLLLFKHDFHFHTSFHIIIIFKRKFNFISRF